MFEITVLDNKTWIGTKRWATYNSNWNQTKP